MEAILATLAELGFEGVLSVECRRRGDAGDAVASCGRHLRELLGAWPATSRP